MNVNYKAFVTLEAHHLHPKFLDVDFSFERKIALAEHKHRLPARHNGFSLLLRQIVW